MAERKTQRRKCSAEGCDIGYESPKKGPPKRYCSETCANRQYARDRRFAEKVERIRELAAQNKSARVIGESIRPVHSKNAIISICRRYKIPLNARKGVEDTQEPEYAPEPEPQERTYPRVQAAYVQTALCASGTNCVSYDRRGRVPTKQPGYDRCAECLTASYALNPRANERPSIVETEF